MHEVSVMASIVEAVLEELRKHDVEKVEEVLAAGSRRAAAEAEQTMADVRGAMGV